MLVTVTGALGSLGAVVVEALVAAGHRVRGLDRDGRAARKRARRLPSGVEVLLGDVRDPALLDKAFQGAGAVFHGAGVLPPFTDDHPAEAESINVGGTRAALEALARTAPGALLIFPSSVTVYGPTQSLPPPRRADDPLLPTDGYSRHKAACEEIVRAAPGPWSILRVGVAVDANPFRVDRRTLAGLFEVRADNRIELVHPRDLARAVIRLVERPAAWNRVLNIGGGPSCRIQLIDLFDGLFGAAGLGPLPAAAFGDGEYYTDWLDTVESQALLDYQRAGFDEIRAEAAHRLRRVRPLVRVLRPLARGLVLHSSRPWRERKGAGR
ncbi:MAG TPA: NAD(P)-dependent oxidoreductase [Polyangia bacterium]|nr:NAD(P)-dependent oxidoreductase [Polyangia bacterium]